MIWIQPRMPMRSTLPTLTPQCSSRHWRSVYSKPGVTVRLAVDVAPISDPDALAQLFVNDLYGDGVAEH